jgi:sugar phosphate isomerase/epimerase
MIDEIGSPRVKVLFEPVNLIGPDAYWRQSEALREMIDQLGPLIVAVHAKDHYLQRRQVTLHIEERVPGQGELDYSTLLSELAKLPREPIVTIEHLSDDARIVEAKEYILGVAERCGVAIH